MEPPLTGAFKSGRIAAVSNPDRNAGIGYPARRNAVRDSHKIGASSGKKDAEILHRTTLFTIWSRDRACPVTFGCSIYAGAGDAASRVSTGLSLAEHHFAITFYDAADAVKFFSGAFQQRLRLLEFLGGDHDQPTERHIEGSEQFLFSDVAAFLQIFKNGQNPPRTEFNLSPQCFRA